MRAPRLPMLFLSYLVAIAFAFLPATASTAGAACNVIPQAQASFRGPLGTLDRPFASPGDVVTLALDPVCHRGTAGAAASSPFDGLLETAIVTIAFAPPPAEPGAVRPGRLLVLAPSCPAIAAKLLACAPFLGGEPPLCRDASRGGALPDLELIDVPDERSLGGRALRFRFPDSRDVQPGNPLLGAGDELTLSGPARIAVTTTADDLPCGLATSACPSTPGGGIRACVDRLFVAGDTCSPAPDAVFGHFTALPIANNFQGACSEPDSVCTGRDDELRMAIDAAGNLLIPIEWSGILVSRDAVPVPRALDATLKLESHAGTGAPLLIPSRTLAASYSPRGQRIEPVFDPLYDPEFEAANPGRVRFFGTADAPRSVLRVARHDAAYVKNARQCSGGSTPGLPCACPEATPAGASCAVSAAICGGAGAVCSAQRTCFDGGAPTAMSCAQDADCPGGQECGPGLFDFRSRLAAGVGPIVLRRGACLGGSAAGAACGSDAACPGGQCSDFALAARDPFPLDGLVQTASLSALVREEAIVDQDLNGDQDATDHIVTLSSRTTGRVQEIGDFAGRPGRAVARIRQGAFSFPALSAAQDMLAFLEPEPLQRNLDANGNGLIFETILRAYAATIGSPTNLLPLFSSAADPAPVFDGRSLVASAQRVFFRQAEWHAVASRRTPLVAVPDLGMSGIRAEPSAISADGNVVAFETGAGFIFIGPDPDPARALEAVHVRDLRTGASENVAAAALCGSCPSEPRLDRCCEAHAGSGCGDPAIEQCVCESNPACCTGSWTEECAAAAAFPCAARCEDHDCCVARGEPGCSDAIIEQCVCAPDVDPFCCDSQWDALCASRVEEERLPAREIPNAMVRGSSMSADGSRVVFETAAGNIVSRGRFDGDYAADCPNDRLAFLGANSPSRCQDVFVRDRSAGETILVSLSSGLVPSNGSSYESAISADGRFVAFTSDADNLAGGPYPLCRFGFGDELTTCSNVFVRDVDGETTERVSLPGETGFDGACSSPALSGDGRIVAFVCSDDDGRGLVVKDRATGRIDILPREASDLSMSSSGRYVAFASFAPDWIPGDTNGRSDVFVLDRDGQTVRRASIAADGAQANDGSFWPSISRDGRFVAFYSLASNLVAPDVNALPDTFLHDLDTQMTARIGESRADASALHPIVEFPNPPQVADGGRSVLHIEFADEFVFGDVVVRAPDESMPAKDVTGDGRLDDTVLRVVQRAAPGAEPVTLCPATSASVAGGGVAFLRPESAGPVTKLGSTCPPGSLVAGGTDLNGDGDATDEVVHFWDGGVARNLAVGATAVALSDAWIGALASEAQQGFELNSDGDTRDDVAIVRAIDDDSWTGTGFAANDIATGADTVAFTVPEAGQGSVSLNPGRSLPSGVAIPGDGDTRDDVLFVYDGERRQLVATGIAAEEFVVGAKNGIVAFRTLESAQGGQSLNQVNGNDADADDGVLFLFAPDVKPPHGPLIATQMAVLPCALEACDPRKPYRVLKDTVRFLTYECDQGGDLVHPVRCPGGGTDLDGDGQATSVVLQMINVAQLATGAAMADSRHVVGSVATGICTNTGAGCTRDRDCRVGSDRGTCFVPPGGCIRDLPGTACDPEAEPGSPSSCPGASQFCQPTGGGGGFCRELQKKCVGGSNAGAACTAAGQCPGGACASRCRTADDCTADALCIQGDQSFQRLVNPLQSETEGATGSISTGAGRCVEVRPGGACTTSDQCERGEFCDGGVCARDQGPCRSQADCATGAICESDLIAQTAADSDRDEVPDFVDNCPLAKNPNQRDRDGDGIGDRCDDATGMRPAHDDYDGDRIADFAIYHKGKGGVQLLGTGRGAGQGPRAIAGVGGRQQSIVQADYDGDGRTDAAAYHKRDGTWRYVSSASGSGELVLLGALGGLGFVPVHGDYDGDRRADPAVYEKSTGVWRYLGSTAGLQTIASLGGQGPGFAPAPGDYDGDGRNDPCVYERATGTWTYLGSTAGRQQIASIGGPGSQPVPGDYDGDGKTDAAAWNPSTGRWVYQGSKPIGGFPPMPREVLGIGQPTGTGGSFVAAQADIDGDRRTDPCAYQPSTGRWEYFGSRAGRGAVAAFGGKRFQPAIGAPNVK